ncbi:MAG: DegT/DnrJ/EryC1/StrS family aminotransferase [Alphaproteobacteria bacterium]|jgi:dTDP-4-amino-4,6-dideoxygalactose transaminase|nr:DegT/DnrJ/EryC1/StrS family aminotransferase [Alphaproteobacteria bacterium]
MSFLPFAKPSIDAATIAEVTAVLQSGWLTTGPRVKQFEEMLQAACGGRRALALNSATAGLHVALLALDLQPGDEVITTPLTFVASLNTIVQAGGRPVLVDIDRATLNIDIDKVAAAITPKTRAVMPVHFAGLSVDLDPLYALADKHGLRIIEDAAHSIGTGYKGRAIGSFGDIQVFSFHPNKNITTGEGGAVVTDDPKVIKAIERLRFHGIDRDAFNRFSKQGSQTYDVVTPGFKYNMLDLQAAIGLHQLPQLDVFIEKRAALAERYRRLLADWPQLDLPGSPAYENRHAWHLFTPRLTAAAHVDRDGFINRMKEHDIGIGLHYTAAHLFSYYQESFGYRPGDFPHAEAAGNAIVSLPLFPDMTEEQQDRVIAAMAAVLGRN